MSDRGVIETGAIPLLSASKRQKIDESSTGWLGRQVDRNPIREPGLWNVNHVQDDPGADFLDVFEHHLVRAIG